LREDVSAGVAGDAAGDVPGHLDVDSVARPKLRPPAQRLAETVDVSMSRREVPAPADTCDVNTSPV
jgi:hypothetical protein